MRGFSSKSIISTGVQHSSWLYRNNPKTRYKLLLPSSAARRWQRPLGPIVKDSDTTCNSMVFICWVVSKTCFPLHNMLHSIFPWLFEKHSVILNDSQKEIFNRVACPFTFWVIFTIYLFFLHCLKDMCISVYSS